MEITLKYFSIITIFFCSASITMAQTWHTWTGADFANNSNMNNSSNWLNGAPVFGDAYIELPNPAPGTTQILDRNGTNTYPQKLYFEASGYKIIDGAGSGTLRLDNVDSDGSDDIRSFGAGVNEISSAFAFGTTVETERIINVGAGNHLLFSGAFSGNAIIIKGDGTMVIDSPTDDTARNFNAKFTISDSNSTLLFNSIEAVNNNFDTGTVGGNGGIITYGNGGTTTFDTNFNIGGDGSVAGGDEIGTFTIKAGPDSSGNRWNAVLGANSITHMQIDDSGNNDKVFLDLRDATVASGNYELSIASGATLNLWGSTIPNGTYTLFENLNSTDDIVGTFDNVNYNGAAVAPENFTLNYNGSSITLDVIGIPETSTLSLLGIALLSFVVFHRKKR